MLENEQVIQLKRYTTKKLYKHKVKQLKIIQRKSFTTETLYNRQAIQLKRYTTEKL